MISREQGASTISRRCIYVAPSNSGDRLGPAFVGTRNPPLGRRLQWRGTKAVTSQQTGQCHTAFLFWWRQRRSQYGAIQSGAASFSIWPCDEDERSPRWRWPGDWPFVSSGCGVSSRITSSGQSSVRTRASARNRRWSAIEHRAIDWAACSPLPGSSK